MKRQGVFGFIGLLVLVCGFMMFPVFNATAQEAGQETAQETGQELKSENSLSFDFYENQLFRWENTATLFFQNQTSTYNFGIKGFMADALKSYPDSETAYNKYRGKMIAGNIFTYGGYAIELGGIGYMFGNLPSDPSQVGQWIVTSLGIVYGGMIVNLIGAFIHQSSGKDLFKSVNLYNRNRTQELN